MRIERVRTVVLAGGRSSRMGFDKLTALFAGEALARRVARALAPLEPLFVATPEVCEEVADVPGVRVIRTPPTAGPAETLALAHAVIPPDEYLAVLPADLPFIDAARVRAFVECVRDDADLSWPVVAGIPGHPVVWSPRARARVAGLRADEAPQRVRLDGTLRSAPIESSDDAYIVDVDTPDRWRAAIVRAEAAGR